MAQTSRHRHSSIVPRLNGRIIKGGRRHSGIYCIEKNIGQGTWGAVYRATALHFRPRTKFAIKCISTKDMSAGRIRRLEREIDIQDYCYKATSGGTLPLYDWFRDDDEHLLYIISEFCPDGDLLERIVKFEIFGDDELVRNLCEQLLDAVENMHENGVFHRDLKPENILCKNDGKTLLVADFGLSTTREYNNDFGVGSSSYMCPEVQGGLNGKTTALSSAKADIWALGVLFFNIAFVEIPWHKAQLSDEIFEEYFYRNRDTLLSRSVVSEEFNEILKSIFRIDPIYRASIPEIRAGIRAIKTFYNKSDPRFQRRYERAVKARAAAENIRQATPILSSSEISNSDSSVFSSIPSFEDAELVPEVPQNVLPKQLVVTNPDVKSANSPARKAEVAHHNAVVDLAKYEFAFVHGGVNNAPTFYDSSDSSTGPITPEQPAVDNGDSAPAIEEINAIANLNIFDGQCKATIALPQPVYDQGRALANDEEVCEERKLELNNSKANNRFNSTSTSDLKPSERRSSMFFSSVARLLRIPENVL